MKKDLMFAPVLLLIGILLSLLNATGMIAHIAISVVGLLVLVAYTLATRKQWKLPVLEIITRAAYGIALISGIVIKISYIYPAAIAHKVAGRLFVLLLAALLIYKLITRKSKA